MASASGPDSSRSFFSYYGPDAGRHLEMVVSPEEVRTARLVGTMHVLAVSSRQLRACHAQPSISLPTWSWIHSCSWNSLPNKSWSRLSPTSPWKAHPLYFVLRWVGVVSKSDMHMLPVHNWSSVSPKMTSFDVQGTYGPFQPNMPVDVPLWMATMLHKRKKCRIQPPGWMNAEQLQGAHCRLSLSPGQTRWLSLRVLSWKQAWCCQVS